MNRLPSLILSFLCIYLLLSGCKSWNNVTEYKTGIPGCRSVVTIDGQWQSQIGVVNDEKELRLLMAPEDGFMKISRVIISTGKKYMLIESYGEGHQSVCIYNLNEFASACSGEITDLKAFRQVDPYPYWITDINWVSDSVLTFSGYSNFSRIDTSMNRPAYDPNLNDTISRAWIWNISTGQFRLSDGKAKCQ
jgi:uncharacterized protein YceK